MLPVFEEFGMKELLPLKLDEPDEGCIRPSEDVYCFLAGDPRVNEQTVLATIHTLFVRNHNLLAKELAVINPHWNDETLFQETRHINAAVIQHITYNEFLPMVLGKEVMQRHDLILQKEGYYDGYDPYTNPSVASGFSSAAFRFGHSLLPSTIERWSKTHRYVGSQRLSEMLQQPYDLYKGGWADNYMMGMINQVNFISNSFVPIDFYFFFIIGCSSFGQLRFPGSDQPLVPRTRQKMGSGFSLLEYSERS